MKYIRKQKLNEGYFKSVEDIKENPDKYKTSTIGNTAKAIIEEKYTSKVLYYTYMALGKYFFQSTKNSLMYSDIVLRTYIKAENYFRIVGLNKPLLFDYKDCPHKETLLEKSDEHIKNWFAKFFEMYFKKDSNGNILPYYPAPIKNISYDDGEFVVNVRTNIGGTAGFCFWTNKFFDAFDKIEKEVSSLVKIPIRIELSLFGDWEGGKGQNDIPFPGNEAHHLDIVGDDVDFDKLDKFIRRYKNIDTSMVIDRLHLYNVDIPSLNYLPEFPFKFHRIIFDTLQGTGFKYNLDAIGNYERFLDKRKYPVYSADLIEKYPEIIFQYDSFLSDDVEKLTNGIITQREFNVAKEYRVPCSFAPYVGFDTSSKKVQFVKRVHSRQE